MTPIDFAYFLQGFAEITDSTPTKKQWAKICKKLEEVKGNNGTSQANFFITWLTGFVEISEASTINAQEWQIITDHLQLVFTKVTPDRKKKADKKTDLEDEIERIKKIIDDDKKDIKPWKDGSPWKKIDPYTVPKWPDPVSPYVPKWPDEWPPKIICSAGDATSTVDISLLPLC